MGTVFSRSGSVRSVQSSRSSSQPANFGQQVQPSRLRLTTIWSPRTWTCIDLQRARWRTRDVAAIQVIDSVVAGTPDLMQIPAILHRASQVGAGGRKRAVLAVAAKHQQAGTVAKAEDHPAVGFQLAYFRGDDFIASQVSHRWWHQIPQQGICEGD